MTAPACERVLLRAEVARGVEKTGVQRSDGRILGFSVITKGMLQDRPMEIDDTTLAQVVKMGNKARNGIKSRFGHPAMSGEALGTLLGRASNFRLDGDRVRADLDISETAYKTPSGDLASYVLELAEKDPDAFGASMVFTGKHEQKLNEEGKPATHPKSGRALLLARVETFNAVDIVDEPAANPAMFSFLTPDVELTAHLSTFLEQFLERPDSVEKAIGFLERFTARKEPDMTTDARFTSPPAPEGGTLTGPISIPVPEASAAPSPEALSAERAMGAKAERERIRALEALAFEGQKELLGKAIDEGWPVERAALEFNKAEKASRASSLAAFRNRPEAPALGPNAAPAEEAGAIASLAAGDSEEEFSEASATKQWEKDPAIRREFFNEKETYFSFLRNRGSFKGIKTETIQK